MHVPQDCRQDAFLSVGESGATAIVDHDGALTYGELRDLVAERTDDLALLRRSLVLVEASNTRSFVITYLALLAAGHVPLLFGAHGDRLAAAWRPNATIATGADGVTVMRHDSDDHDLHPDLALLLSTSGSTGAPKLVRLSHRNLTSNAAAIGQYLGLTAADRGITSLPLHYCYGLSVLHSHLAVGAGVVLTDASVVDAAFAHALVEHDVTNVAGVPHSFELLERAGPERLHVPSLRFVTCAGGRMPPADVRRWADRTAAWGVDLFVMYGQTEATARMAYLPPALVADHPDAVGVAIPGGELSLGPVEGAAPGVGELVYRGDNVMLGYAECAADLALGATIDELRTGDLAQIDDGLVRIVGRRSRFVKPFGMRIDLDVVERRLRERWADADVAVSGDDERLVIAAGTAPTADVIAATTEMTGLPPTHVAAAVGPPMRTAAGKVDYAALRATAPTDVETRPSTASSGGVVAAVFAEVLGRSPGPSDTFVALGGDSLNYVECSVRLEREVGSLPADWHATPVATLEAAVCPPRRWARLDTTVVLRAVGIATIVSTHMGLWYFPGGAHLLLAVVGYNVARFLVPVDGTRARVTAGLRTAARTAGPTMAWIAAGMLLVGAYGAQTLLLANNYVGPPGHGDDLWHFWFIEVMVHLVLLTTLLVALPPVHRIERKWPYAFALGLLAVALVGRTDWAQWFDPGNTRFRTHAVAWFFVLGWLVQRSTQWWQRVMTLAVLALTIPDTFRPQREFFIAAGLVLLLLVPRLPWPRLAVRPVAATAAASLWILLTHFTVWPILDDALDRRLAYVLTITAGVATHLAVEQTSRWARRRYGEGRIHPVPSGGQDVMAATISA